ncbi:hypothetical protein C8J56DRAFT_1046687 [Mycena floridula]|nr:hypothetical protein C8J56DRAFT_1046687 [Mycena floridula]
MVSTEQRTTEYQPTFEHSTEQEDTPDLTEFSMNTLYEPEKSSQKQLPYGQVMDTDIYMALCPSMDDFLYSTEEVHCPPYDLPPELIPPPSAQPLDGYTYPQSLIWRLIKTNEYLIGCCYEANLDISSEAIEADRERMINLELPPEIDAIKTEDMFVHQPVPGMVKMIPGIPFCWQVVGGPRDDEIACYVFGGCVMMLKSIQNLHPHIYEQVYALAKELHLLAFGGFNSEGKLV